MSCTQCAGIAQEFNARVARRDLRRYRKRGAPKTTTWLLDMVVGEGVRGATFLDVGGGVGALQHGFIRAGAAAGIHAEASPAYLAAARDESKRLGHAERIRSLEGDFVSIAPEVEPVDVVTLDRVICCYHDMEALVDASASRAKRVYGLVFPRERLALRVAAWVLNRVQRVRRRDFNLYLHPLAAVEARVESHGLLKRFHRQSFLWHVQLYTRHPGRSEGP